jgi:hypothetical protein
VLRLVVASILAVVALFPLVAVMYLLTKNNDLAWALGMALSLIGVPVLILNIWRAPNSSDKRLYPESYFIVTIDESEILVKRPDGSSERVAINDLSEISIMTNSSGPWGIDLWWVFSGAGPKSGCVFPGGATGEDKIIEWAETLPAFNTKAIVDAMCCTSEARFVCWTRSA